MDNPDPDPVIPRRRIRTKRTPRNAAWTSMITLYAREALQRRREAEIQALQEARARILEQEMEEEEEEYSSESDDDPQQLSITISTSGTSQQRLVTYQQPQRLPRFLSAFTDHLQPRPLREIGNTDWANIQVTGRRARSPEPRPERTPEPTPESTPESTAAPTTEPTPVPPVQTNEERAQDDGSEVPPPVAIEVVIGTDGQDQ